MNGRVRARHAGTGLTEESAKCGDFRRRGHLAGVLLAAACLAPPAVLAIEVIDTGTFVRQSGGKPEMYWIDNDTLLYGGARTPEDASKYERRRLMTYSVATRQLKDLGSYGGGLCYDRGYVRYLRPAPGTENTNGPWDTILRYTGRFGEEKLTPLAKPLPGHSSLLGFEHLQVCLWDSELPPLPAWTKGRWIKELRPEHGFVQMEPKPDSVFGTYPVRLYRPGDGPDGGVPITAMREDERLSLWRYVPHKNAYWVTNSSTTSPRRPPGTFRAWWVYPDGRVELFMSFDLQLTLERHYSWVPQIPVRDGLLLAKDRQGVPRWPFGNLGHAGLYRFDIKPQHEKLVAGEISNWAVSPNGCRVAFGNDTRLNYEWPHQYRVQIIDVCESKGGKNK